MNNYYKNCNVKESLLLAKIESDRVFKITKKIEDPDIDNLSGIFLKDGASLIATPITQPCNLSISFSRFPDACKIAKLKGHFKNGSNTRTSVHSPSYHLCQKWCQN